MRCTMRRCRAAWVFLYATMRIWPSSFLVVVQATRPDHNNLKNAGVDVSWSGDYRQLRRRLGQAYRWSQSALQLGRQTYEDAVDRSRELFGQFQDAQYDRQYRHLYPYLEKRDPTTDSETAAATVAAATLRSPPKEAEAQVRLPTLGVRRTEALRRPPSFLSQGLTRGGQQQQERQQERARGVSRGGYASASGAASSAVDAFRTAVALGMVLAFNSGFINGCCLSGATAHKTKQAVASVTGAYTNSALGLASGNLSQFTAQLQVLLSYIVGSAVAGWLNPRPVAMDFSSSRHPALLVAGALLAVSSFMATHYSDAGSTGFFLLAAMANGLQNSVTSSATANLCRTSHYTGISTDIGTYVGQLLRGNSANASRLRVFCGLAASFWIGGVVSYFTVQRYGGWSLLLGAAIYFFVGSGTLQTIFLTPKPGPTFTTTRFETTDRETQEEQVPIESTSLQQAPLARTIYPKGSLQSLAM